MGRSRGGARLPGLEKFCSVFNLNNDPAKGISESHLYSWEHVTMSLSFGIDESTLYDLTRLHVMLSIAPFQFLSLFKLV